MTECFPFELVRSAITLAHLATIAEAQFGDMVKAVVDVKRGVMVIAAELHSDEEAALLEDGSLQADVWGVNLYPGEAGDGFVELDSMSNIRPAQGNHSRSVIDEGLRDSIRRAVAALVSDA
jgi:outer membrane receptor for monomeric catechols